MKQTLTLLFLLFCFVFKAQPPTAQFSVSSATQCVNSPISFSNLSTNGAVPIVSQVWDFGDGTSSSALSPSHTYSSAGTYTIILVVTDANGVADSEVKVNYLVVNPAPNANYTYSSNGCTLPVGITFSNTSSGGLNYNWDFGNGQNSTSQNPSVVNYTIAGNYQVQLITTNSFGCKDTLSQSIVISNFETSFTAPVTGCVGSPISLVDASTAGANAWNWTLTGSNLGSSGNQNPSPSYSTPGNYTISLTSQNTLAGCSDNFSQNITINSLPNPSFSGGPFSGCAPQSITLSNTSIESGATYLWNFGDGTTFSGTTPPAHNYTTNGTYTVSLTMTDANGCSSTVTQPAYVVLIPPNVSFTADVTEGCDPLDVQLTAASTSLDPITDWLWDFGDGATYSGETPPIHTYAAGVFDVSLTVTTQSGCVATYTIPEYIAAGHIDLVDFVGDPQIQCAKTDVNFTDLSIISLPHDPNEVSYFWQFGDGGTSTQQNPTYDYPADTGYFDVTLIVEFRGCYDTLIRPDYEYILAPISRFTPSQTLFCNPTTLPVTITVNDNSIIGALPDDADMTWDWGDGTFTNFDDPDFDDADLGTTSHTYSSYGTYTIMQIIHNYTTGCADSTTATIEVSYTDASFLVSDSVCVGSAIGFQSTSTSTHPFGTFDWYPGDGGYTSGSSSSYTYWNPGTYSVMLVATNNVGCRDTAIVAPITALNLPVAGIDPDDAAGCAPFTVTYSNLSTTAGNGMPLSSFSFYFPDDNTTQTTTNTSTQVSHTFLLNGNFPVSITATDVFGCVSAPAYSTISTTQPTALYYADNVVCEGETVTAYNLSSGNNPLTYNWYLDGVMVSTNTNYSTSFNEPTFPLSSHHDHQLELITTDANGCKDTINGSITVSTPMAIFNYVLDGAATNANGDFICPPVFVDFTDQSINYGGISSWYWDFGDGKNSLFQSPNNTYVFAGTYTASLSIVDAYGCTDDTVLVDYLTIFGPSANPSWTEYENTCGLYASFDIGATDNVADILWTLDDGTTVNDLSNFTHLYSTVGTYDPYVTIYDNNNCAINYPLGPITLAEPPQLNIQIHGDVILCHGDANGNVHGSVSGGIPPYQVTLVQTGAVQTVSIDGGNFNFGGLNGAASGGFSSYSVSVTDASGLPGFPGCATTSSSVTMQEPSAIQVNSSLIQVGCSGAATGAINLSVSGGTAPYSFNWSNGQNTEDINNLLAGIYSVSIQDANGTSNGCSATGSFTITQPTPISLSATQINNVCNGASNGSVDLTVQGGTAPYTYDWSNDGIGDFNDAQDLTGLVAGNYSVNVQDANGSSFGCFATLTVSISEPSALILSTIPSQVTCNQQGNGSIDLNASGGTQPYTYSWSNGAVTQDISNLVPGIYTATVHDAAGNTFGCQATTTVIITEPAAISLQTTPQQVSCNAGTNGQIDLSVVGGTSPYIFNWSNGEVTEDISNLPAGNYTVTVHDANWGISSNVGCSASTSVTITQPGPILLGETHSNILCANATTGSIDLTVSGGTTGYVYDWDNDGTGDLNDLQDLSNIVAGSYSVHVYDANYTATPEPGCTATLSVSITQPLSPLSLNENHSDVLCFNAQTGSINLTAIGGTAPYTYDWDIDGTSDFDDLQDLTSIAAGIYTVQVHDANYATSPNSGCQATLTISIIQPTAPVTISETHTAILCKGAQTGQIDATINGGSSPYSIDWNDDGLTDFNDPEDLINLPAGTYTIQVRDNNYAQSSLPGCTATSTVVIIEPNASVSLTENHTNVACNGASTGSINLSVSGGTPGYLYDWDNDGTSDTDDMEDLTGLPAGAYEVLVYDANYASTPDPGCMAILSIVIAQPNPVNVTAAITNLTCNGGGNGAIDLSITGGVSPYLIDWDIDLTGDFDDVEDLNTLVAGTYTVIVHDNNGNSFGCVDTATFTIVDPSGMNITLTPSIYIGGYNVYECLNNGTITSSVNGGTAPYQYDWNTDGFGDQNDPSSLNNLDTGWYQVIVIDQQGCTKTDSIYLSKPSPLIINTLSSPLYNGNVNISCHGGNNGSINTTSSGGVAPYSYNWVTSNGSGLIQTNQNQIGLSAGSYSITVTDQHGCTVDSNITLIQPPPLVISGIGDSLLCAGDANGQINGMISGGTAPYQLTVLETNAQMAVGISGGTYTFSNLNGQTGGGSAIYTVYVTDANGSSGGCTIQSNNISIYEPTPLSIQLIASIYNGGINVVECLQNGTVTAIINGGTSPYSYDYSSNGYIGFTDGAGINGLNIGTYGLIAQDANNCIITDSISLISSPPLLITQLSSPLTISGENISCFQGSDGSIQLTVAGGISPYTYSWTGQTSSTNEDLQNVTAGIYLVEIIDANGCQVDSSIILNQPPPIEGQFLTTNATCNNTATGVIATTISGGTPAYAFDWSGPGGFSSTSEDLQALAAGTYTLQLHDAAGTIAGCTYDTTIIISEPAPVISTISPGGDVTFCYGDSVVLTANAGSAYLWSTGETTQSIVIYESDNYFVIITDSSGCEGQSQLSPVLVYAIPTLDAGPDQEICLGESAILEAVSNGVITWSNGIINNVAFYPTQNGIYIATATSGQNCTITDTVSLIVHPLSNIQAGSDIEICENESIILTASGGQSYLWSGGIVDGIPFIPPVGTHTYSVSGSSLYGCINTDSLIVTVNPLPQLSVDYDPIIGCVPQRLTLINTTPNVTDCFWVASNGVIQNGCQEVSFDFEDPGCYDITFTSSSLEGCTNTIELFNAACLEGYPEAAFTPSLTETTIINTTVFFDNQSMNAANYLWNFGDNSGTTYFENPIHTYSETPGYYLVTLIAYSSYGCPDTAYSYIQIKNTELIYVPNTFTPNEDDFNNTFKPVFTEGFNANDFVLYIFNRWGELIFESHDPDIGWDGSYGSMHEIEVVQDGTYVWKIVYGIEGSNQKKTLVGHVNVLK